MTSVDITILSWDRVDDTIKAIQSALDQRDIDARVIVVDQGSNKVNLQPLTEYCTGRDRLHVIYNDKNLGVPGGRNQAAAAGQSDYIIGLDNDAEFVDEYQVARAVGIMEQDYSLAVLAFRILRFNTTQDDGSSWFFNKDIYKHASTSFFTTHFVGAGHMIRRKAFEAVNRYDDTLFFMLEEVDLSNRLINAGHRILYTPEVVIGHKVSAEHRVKWDGKRWELNVRNAYYLKMKSGASWLKLLFNIFLLLRRGKSSNLLSKTLSGLKQAFKLTKVAKQKRKANPTNIETSAAKSYKAFCNDNRHKGFFARVKERLKAAKRPIGNSE
jgi:GT2 family glycosyltransferase